MRYTLTLLLFFLLDFQATAQDSSRTRIPFFEPAPKFAPVRFWAVTGGLTVGYTATSIGLAKAWYSEYDRGKFHFFNDWYGWRQMDKFGHLMTNYFESKWVGQLYHWAGFSMSDIGFNAIGASAYLGQELLWEEQRVLFKISSHRPRYSTAPIKALNSNETTSLKERAADLYGTSIPELFFKEYNGETIWASVNIASFLNKKPKWLPAFVNVAVGYGIENVFGAERNKWYNDNISVFEAPADVRRHSQIFLSLDIDFERIPTKSKALKSFFALLNVFKVPFPAVEFNTLGKVKLKPFYF